MPGDGLHDAKKLIRDLSDARTADQGSHLSCALNDLSACSAGAKE